MRIKQLDIYGYGKWIDQSFDFNDGLQVLYGLNEAGKSTLQSFIKSMLFGFPNRVRGRYPYEPKDTDKFGGRLLLTETDYGNVWIERTPIGLQLMTDKGEVLDATVLDELLGGLDETLYDDFYAFTLDNLQALSKVGKEQLNDYFLSISTLGSDQLLKIATQFEDENDKMYRPRGSVPYLNQLLTDYDELAQQRQKASQEQQRYNQLVQDEAIEIEKIKQLTTSIEQFEKKIYRLEHLIDLYEIYLKKQTAERELKHLTYTEMPDDAINQYNYHKKLIAADEKELIQLKEQIQQLENQSKELTRVAWAEKHQKQREAWKIATQKVKVTQHEIEQLERLIQETDYQLSSLSNKYHFDPDKISSLEQFEQQLEQAEVLKTEFSHKKEEIHTVSSQRQVYLDQLHQQQAYTAKVRQQLATLENQRINDEALLIQQTSMKDYFLPLILLIAGIILLGLYFWNQTSIFMWSGMISLGVAFIGGGIFFNRHRQLIQAYHESPLWDKISRLKEDEDRFLSTSQDLMHEINLRGESLDALNNDLASINDAIKKWLESTGFSKNADLDLIIQTEPLKEYYQMLDTRHEHASSLGQENLKVNRWLDLIEPLLERFPTSQKTTRELIRYVEELEADLIEQTKKATTIQDTIEKHQDKIEEKNQSIKKYEEVIRQLFQQTNSQNEHDLVKKVEDNQTYQELTRMNDLYQQQLKEHLDELEKIENKQDLTSMVQSQRLKLEQVKAQRETHYNQRAALNNAIRQLELENNFQDINQIVENKAFEVQSAMMEWGTRQLAKEMILFTLRHGMDDPLPTLNAIATDIFKTLSSGRYTKIRLNQQSIRVLQHTGVLFTPDELSQGTLEQLYVSIRLAFILTAQNMVKMPIIIDDAFVNFDEYRKDKMYHVLNEIKDQIQVLFFTFDSNILELVDDEEVIHLEEYTSK